jgi:hypothetical protein
MKRKKTRGPPDTAIFTPADPLDSTLGPHPTLSAAVLCPLPWAHTAAAGRAGGPGRVSKASMRCPPRVPSPGARARASPCFQRDASASGRAPAGGECAARPADMWAPAWSCGGGGAAQDRMELERVWVGPSAKCSRRLHDTRRDRPSVGRTDGRMGRSSHVVLRHCVGTR